jgi:hypothetical protein
LNWIKEVEIGRAKWTVMQAMIKIKNEGLAK